MTEKKAKKRALVPEDTTKLPYDNSTYDPTRVPEHKRRADGRAVKSNGKPYTPGVGNPKHSHIPQEDRCTAVRKKDKKPCQKLRMAGSTVCGTHGGRPEHTRRAAMHRLQEKAQDLVQRLLDIAEDEELPAVVQLKAIESALDRGGVKSSDKVDIAHEVKPYEQLMTRIMRVSEEPTDPVIVELRESDDRY